MASRPLVGNLCLRTLKVSFAELVTVLQKWEAWEMSLKEVKNRSFLKNQISENHKKVKNQIKSCLPCKLEIHLESSQIFQMLWRNRMALKQIWDLSWPHDRPVQSSQELMQPLGPLQSWPGSHWTQRPFMSLRFLPSSFEQLELRTVHRSSLLTVASWGNSAAYWWSHSWSQVDAEVVKK